MSLLPATFLSITMTARKFSSMKFFGYVSDPTMNYYYYDWFSILQYQLIQMIFIALNTGIIDYSYTYMHTPGCKHTINHSTIYFQLHVPPLVLKARHLSGSAFCWD